MASDWEIVSLVEHCKKIGSGATPRGGSSVYLEEGEITLIRSQNVYNDGFKRDGLVFITEEAAEKLKNVIVEENDILLNITGDSVARVCMVDKQVLPARVNQHVSIIRPKESSFNPLYLRYQLVSPHVQQLLLNYASAGATRHALTKSMIENLGIPKPDLDTQNNIAHILGSLDDKIELNRQMNETLEAMAQALFKSWFVDFDPVIDNALAVGNAIPDEFVERAEQRKGIEKKDSSDIQGLFPDEFEFTEEMGWIPKGWGTSEVNGFGQVVCGKTPSKQKAEYYGNDISFIKIPDMHNVAWATTTIDNLSFEGSNSQKNKLIPKGSICVSCIATVGKVLMTSRDAHTNQQINSLIPAEKNTLYYLYSSFLGMEKILQDLASGGAVTLNLNTSNFSKIKLILPPNPVLDAYDSSVSSLYEKNLKSLIQNQELAKLRDTLLPKLMSGELRIVDAAAFVENI